MTILACFNLSEKAHGNFLMKPNDALQRSSISVSHYHPKRPCTLNQGSSIATLRERCWRLLHMVCTCFLRWKMLSGTRYNRFNRMRNRKVSMSVVSIRLAATNSFLRWGGNYVLNDQVTIATCGDKTERSFKRLANFETTKKSVPSVSA
jgi:hypothetical protein